MEQQQSLTDQLKAFFSPPVLAALRYALTAISPILAIVGIVALSPQQIDHIISVAQQIGTAAGAIAALIGVMLPIGAAIWGTLRSTLKSQIQSVKDIASAPASAAPLAQDAKQALIAATIAQPEVQTIVTDKATADAAPSESVVAADRVAILKG